MICQRRIKNIGKNVTTGEQDPEYYQCCPGRSLSGFLGNPVKNSDKAQETIFHDFILRMMNDVGVGVVKKNSHTSFIGQSLTFGRTH